MTNKSTTKLDVVLGRNLPRRSWSHRWYRRRLDQRIARRYAEVLPPLEHGGCPGRGPVHGQSNGHTLAGTRACIMTRCVEGPLTAAAKSAAEPKTARTEDRAVEVRGLRRRHLQQEAAVRLSVPLEEIARRMPPGMAVEC